MSRWLCRAFTNSPHSKRLKRKGGKWLRSHNLHCIWRYIVVQLLQFEQIVLIECSGDMRMIIKWQWSKISETFLPHILTRRVHFFICLLIGLWHSGSQCNYFHFKNMFWVFFFIIRPKHNFQHVERHCLTISLSHPLLGIAEVMHSFRCMQRRI